MLHYLRRLFLFAALSFVYATLFSCSSGSASAPTVSPAEGNLPPIPISPLGKSLLPPSMLEGGDRLPNVEEIIEQLGVSREIAVVEHTRLRRELTARDAAEGRLYTIPIGPETAGSTILIAEKRITLPPDVYIESMLSTGLCGPGLPCERVRFPAYTLRRGGSIISVDNAGQFWMRGEGWITTPPVEFEFLVEALAP